MLRQRAALDKIWRALLDFSPINDKMKGANAFG